MSAEEPTATTALPAVQTVLQRYVLFRQAWKDVHSIASQARRPPVVRVPVGDGGRVEYIEIDMPADTYLQVMYGPIQQGYIACLQSLIEALQREQATLLAEKQQ